MSVKTAPILPSLPSPDTPVYIVGGGSSLIGFDWELLRDKFVIAVNKAFYKLPEAKIIYFSDGRFWDEFSVDAKKHKAMKVSIAVVKDADSVVRFIASDRTGVDLIPGRLCHGNNSGYAAMNLALHLKPKRIRLLGFDMKLGHGGKHHWHDGYRIMSRPTVFEKMTPYFPRMSAFCTALGVEVVNIVGPSGSALTVFPTMPLTEFVREVTDGEHS